MDQNKKSGVGIKALPNVAIQSFSLFKKSQNKEKLAATGSPNYRRQALGVFARLTFFSRAKTQRNSEIIAPYLMQAEHKGKIAPEILRGRLLAPLQGGIGTDALCVLASLRALLFFTQKSRSTAANRLFFTRSQN
jgi:hypothetical protein